MFAGSIASLAVLGAPDIVLLTLSEFADQARRICRAADLPLLVDADHGYGNALNVMRAVQELETAGIAALTIEDTALPANYGASAPGLLPLEEGMGKIRAALAAREDPDLVVVARTSAVAIDGLAEGVARARAYGSLGPDALFFTGVTNWDQVAALTAASGLPVILGGIPASLDVNAALAAAGVRVSLQGHQPFMASVQAIHDTLKALRDGVRPADITGTAPAGLMREVTRAETYEEWTRRFLGG
jgi:carboxyvinyl-carboxyphosphonate phosphorylmutase